MKEYCNARFSSEFRFHLGGARYSRQQSNLTTAVWPVTDFQHLINQGWTVLQMEISPGRCTHDEQSYYFLLEREIPSEPQSEVQK